MTPFELANGNLINYSPDFARSIFLDPCDHVSFLVLKTIEVCDRFTLNRIDVSYCAKSRVQFIS